MSTNLEPMIPEDTEAGRLDPVVSVPATPDLCGRIRCGLDMMRGFRKRMVELRDPFRIDRDIRLHKYFDILDELNDVQSSCNHVLVVPPQVSPHSPAGTRMCLVCGGVVEPRFGLVGTGDIHSVVGLGWGIWRKIIGHVLMEDIGDE